MKNRNETIFNIMYFGLGLDSWKIELSHRDRFIAFKITDSGTLKSEETADNSKTCPDIKVHRANMGPTWGRQEPGGPHVGHVNLAIWVVLL